MARPQAPLRSTLNDRTRSRLDELLVERGIFPSRSRAKDAISRGCVRVSGEVQRKAGALVHKDIDISVEDVASGYVARSALKLLHALDHFDIGVEGCNGLDVGASTGGFTQALLERGAAHVVALDVGHDQLHPSLRNHPRVSLLEGYNARNLVVDDLPYRPVIITIDVSFISQTLVLPAVTQIAASNARTITLIKPQFELNKIALGKGGLVSDPADHVRAIDRVSGCLGELGWAVSEPISSPIEGGKGNVEFLINAWKP